MSYAVPAILKPHFGQLQMPTATRPNLPDPHSGHCLLAFSFRCTFVYSLRILMPYLAPRPFSDFLRAVAPHQPLPPYRPPP